MGIGELYEKYEHQLLRFARSLVTDMAEAEDLVQETFLRAITNINLLSTLKDYQVKSWLFKVLKNCMIDKKRREKFEVPVELNDEQYEFADDTDMDLKIITGEAMSYLSDKVRDIVYKRYWLGMTSKEIAAIMSMPDSTVRYHLSTAINLLKNKLKVI